MRAPRHLLMVSSIALLACGAAYADSGDGGDNGMSPFYGDSWADLQAHTDNMPMGPWQALQDRAEAEQAFARMRDNARATMHRWRDDINHVIHRSNG